MKRKKRTKLIQEGEFVAEVEVELLEADEGCSPYLSLEDAYKLDDVRESQRRGDLQAAASLGRIFRLKPAAIPSRGKSKSLAV
jgi:hypothetical protein